MAGRYVVSLCIWFTGEGLLNKVCGSPFILWQEDPVLLQCLVRLLSIPAIPRFPCIYHEVPGTEFVICIYLMLLLWCWMGKGWGHACGTGPCLKWVVDLCMTELEMFPQKGVHEHRLIPSD
jgi:hypothetical protein